MSEVYKCFQFLSENVPQWIADLESLEKKVKSRQDHISRVPVPVRKLKKTGSNESIRPHSGSGNDGVEVISAPQDGELANPVDDQQLLRSRKRKTASILSNETVPSKYRTRSMIIVYYDSDIQKCFEQVVRHIGTARNHIRRARTAHRMEALANGDCDSFVLGTRSGLPGYASLAMLHTARGPPPRPSIGADSGSRRTDAFGTTDAALEKAQSLCERGAHQFLREGDCEAEIIGAKESFEESKRLSDQELQRLREEEAKREQEKEKEDPKSEKLIANNNVFLCSGPIEVDDDQNSTDDLDELDDPVIQIPSYRSRRLMARS